MIEKIIGVVCCLGFLGFFISIFNAMILLKKTNNKTNSKNNIGNVSDGYHTFNELYYHRMILFSIICNQNKEIAWKSKLHDDGTMFENYFIVGINTKEGQYTYHYNLKYWDNFKCKVLESAPKYDGHKPNDIDRLLTLIEK
jgi:hypothetical protein